MSERTLIAVVSCAAYQARRIAVDDTWGSVICDGIEVFSFVGADLEVPDDYANLPQKTYAIVRAAVDHGCNRLIKVDDDTYLRLPDALSVLSNGHCVGHIRNDPPHNAGIPYPQGGCYSLSLRAMEAVLAAPEFFSTGLEDAAVGKALHAAGIPLKHSDRIRTDYRMGVPAPDNDIISTHHCSPETMRAIHNKFATKGEI